LLTGIKFQAKPTSEQANELHLRYTIALSRH